MASPAVRTPMWQPQVESSRSVAHWNSRNAWNTSDKKPKAAAPDCVISREEFLSGHVLSKQHPLAHLPGSYSMRAEAIAMAPPLTRPAPPPGLELPDSRAVPSGMVAAESETAPMPEKPNKQSVVDSLAPKVEEIAPMPEKANDQSVADSSAQQVKDYKVLLQNMPDAMLKECMLRAMLEQGNLKDVTNLVFRANGKVLITFASYASVHKCINHFHGRQWGGVVPVSASYVFVASAKERQAAAASKAPSMAAVKAKSFNINAPVFVPSSEKIDSSDLFMRQFSGASTDAGPVSEGASEAVDSEDGFQAECA